MTETLDDKCIWVKSQSITEHNEMYELCHHYCDGKDRTCAHYINFNYERINWMKQNED